MAIFRSISSKRIINGNVIETSESAIISNQSYTTNGEYTLVTRGISKCEIVLDEITTDHVVIKSLTKTLVKSLSGVFRLPPYLPLTFAKVSLQ